VLIGLFDKAINRHNAEYGVQARVVSGWDSIHFNVESDSNETKETELRRQTQPTKTFNTARRTRSPPQHKQIHQ
jgi:hypothetical protein